MTQHATPESDAPREDSSPALLALLDELGIAYELTEHEAVFTVEEADRTYGHLPGGHSKNLLLRNKKGDRHYLVVLESHKRVDLKALRGLLGESTLSFASPERLWRHLRLTPGSVTPFGLMHDPEHRVTLMLDRDLLGYERLNFHPNRNTATVTVSRDGLLRFLAHTGHTVNEVELPS